MATSPLSSGFQKLPSNLKGALVLMMSAILFSLMTVFVKLLGTHLHITQILLARQVVMTMVVLPSILSGFPGVLHTSQPYLQITRILLALGAMLFTFTAVVYMPLAEATALGFAKSFFITIFAILILKEAVGVRRWIAVLLGFLGVLVMLRPGADSFTVYGVMAVAGAACAGAVMVIIRLMSRQDRPTTILAWQATGVGLIIAIPAIYFWKWPTLFEWVMLAAMGLTAYGAQMANIIAYKWGEASLLASLDYVRLLYATFFGWLVFSTLPASSTWIGASLIVFASVYTVYREHRRRQELTRSPNSHGFGE